MELNFELITAVREAQNAAETAVRDYVDLKNRYQLTDEGKLQHLAELMDAARETAIAAKNRGFAAIDKKCEELDAQEKRASERRANDPEYWRSLETKLHIFNAVNVKEQNDSTLKDFFAEFKNDPIAGAAISSALNDPMRGVNILPDNNNGKRQEHLQKIVRPAFERAMNKACDLYKPPRDMDRDIATEAIFSGQGKTEVEAFCAYCRSQDAEFSKDDISLWGRK